MYTTIETNLTCIPPSKQTTASGRAGSGSAGGGCLDFLLLPASSFTSPFFSLSFFSFYEYKQTNKYVSPLFTSFQESKHLEAETVYKVFFFSLFALTSTFLKIMTAHHRNSYGWTDDHRLYKPHFPRICTKFWIIKIHYITFPDAYSNYLLFIIFFPTIFFTCFTV